LREPFAIVPESVLRGPSSRAVHVYAYLAWRAGAERRCWPALETIAENVGCSRATAVRALAELVGVGLVRREPHGRSTMYVLGPVDGAVESGRELSTTGSLVSLDPAHP
jgi:DNA-binding IclR family transcriptional regulator